MAFAPLAVVDLVPHRPPMLLVDTLVSAREGAGTCHARVRPDSLFVSGGELDPAAMVELMAQAFAAVSGYENCVQGTTPAKGYLVAVKTLRILDRVLIGDELAVEVEGQATIGGFCVVHGTVSRDGQPVAQGRLSVWIPPSGERA